MKQFRFAPGHRVSFCPKYKEIWQPWLFERRLAANDSPSYRLVHSGPNYQ